MRISWNWLKQYAPVDIPVQEAADILTSTGLEVEGVETMEPVRGMLAGVVVGEVVACDKHPDADRLSVCQVNVGVEELLTIVCGAPNVAVGQKVLVATVGSTLYPADGSEFKIKRSKIRGVESMGMICAEDELGLGKGHDGIIVLPARTKVGTRAADHYDLKSDHVLEIGLTPNRSDALGHIGVARDLLAALNFRKGKKHRLALASVEAFKNDNNDLPIKISIEDTNACPRYAGVSLSQVQVGPSPDWLQQRLLSIGLKPINNVVDVTNFVQHETGTPLHAFDAARISDHQLVVKQLPNKTKFTTLDEKERVLDEADLMICDTKGGLCIAGVFGGMHSGVSSGTNSIFLESAIFEPTSIRKTAKRHALHTDASFRFERSVDPEMSLYALKRAALLLKEVAGAQISSNISDHYPHPSAKVEVRVAYAKVNSLAGQVIPKADVLSILHELDIVVENANDDGFTAIIPKYRVDVTRPADVVEEIMRIYGFDRIAQPTTLRVPVVKKELTTTEELRKAISGHLAGRGFREIMTPSLASATSATTDKEKMVQLSNPLSSEMDVMRTNMLNGMLSAVAYNLNRQQKDLRFFEKGRVYELVDGKVIESERIALLITGRRWKENWRSKKRGADLHDAKEEVELILERILSGEKLSLTAMDDHSFLTAGQLTVRNRPVGILAKVSGKLTKAQGVDQDVYYAELYPQTLLKLRRKRKVQFEEVPRFPSVRRDLSMLLGDNVRFEELRDLAFQAERKLLRQVDLFDVYQGDKLPEGKKSYAMSFILQDVASTLTDKQVDKAMERIRETFEKRVGAELRG